MKRFLDPCGIIPDSISKLFTRMTISVLQTEKPNHKQHWDQQTNGQWELQYSTGVPAAAFSRNATSSTFGFKNDSHSLVIQLSETLKTTVAFLQGKLFPSSQITFIPSLLCSPFKRTVSLSLRGFHVPSLFSTALGI